MTPRRETSWGTAQAPATESQGRPFVLRTRIYRAVWTPALDASLTRCRHAQRALYNKTIDAVASEGGRVPPAQRSQAHPDGLYGQLTAWRAEHAWIGAIPTALARPAISQARRALAAHEEAVAARCQRLLDEHEAWAKWMAEHPEWDPGDWDRLPAREKRRAIKAGTAPPKSTSTWRDERAGDGSRAELHLRRKRCDERAVTWDTPPRRVDTSTLALPGLGEVEVVANHPLPDGERLRSARLCTRRGRRGRTRLEVHLTVRVDVVPRTKRPRKTPLVAGADMGCADTLTLHDGKTLALPDHEKAMGRALRAQTRMNRCVKGSRQWRDARASMRRDHRRMKARDTDAIRKLACSLAQRFDVVGLESLQIKTMTESAKARSVADVEQVQRLNRSIRRACWGITQRAVTAAFEARGSRALKLPATDSSDTCAEDGHVDAKNRKGKRFRCTGCGHTDDADVNAARIMRGRALRWLALRRTVATDGEAHKALRREIEAARERGQSTTPAGAEAITKPACAAPEQDNGGAGAPSTAPARAGTPRDGPEADCPAGAAARGHEERSI